MDLLEIVPEEYKDKEYLKSIKDVEGLFKQFDNLQPLIGAVKVPKDDAGQEDWDKFYSRLGRPDSSDKYSFTTGATDDKAKEVEAKMKGVFHKANLTDKQAKEAFEGYMEVLSKEQESMTSAELARQAELAGLLDEKLGADKDKVLGITDRMVNEFAPDFKDAIDGLNGESKIALATVMKGIHDKYMKEDDLGDLSGGLGSNSGNTPEDIHGEILKYRADNREALTNEFNPQHDTVRKTLNEMYANLTRVKKKEKS